MTYDSDNDDYGVDVSSGYRKQLENKMEDLLPRMKSLNNELISAKEAADKIKEIEKIVKTGGAAAGGAVAGGAIGGLIAGPAGALIGAIFGAISSGGISSAVL